LIQVLPPRGSLALRVRCGRSERRSRNGGRRRDHAVPFSSWGLPLPWCHSVSSEASHSPLADCRLALGPWQSKSGNRRILSLIEGKVPLEKSLIHAIFPDGNGTWRFVQIWEEVLNGPTTEIRNPKLVPTALPAKPLPALSR